MMGLQLLDWFIILCCVLAASGGYRLGFVTRVASWVGIALGLVLAYFLVPTLLRSADAWQEASKLGLVLVTLLMSATLGQILGTIVGARLSDHVPQGKWRQADRAVGSAFGVIGVLFLVWALSPVAANVPGWPSQQARSSRIAAAVQDATPDIPASVREITNLVSGSASFRPVFEGLTAAPDIGPAPQSVSLPATTVESVKLSTVRVEGIACRRTQNGSGFAVGPGLFATNAHVVAGEKETKVIAPDGESHDAYVVAFDSDRDIALLRTLTYSPRALPIAEPKENAEGAVFGHPGGQREIAVSPAVIRDKRIASGLDLYDNHDTRREILVLAARLAQGDSGGALVNTDGEVTGIAFAIAPDNPDTAYALHTKELRAVMANVASSPVTTGRCIRD